MSTPVNPHLRRMHHVVRQTHQATQQHVKKHRNAWLAAAVEFCLLTGAETTMKIVEHKHLLDMLV